uniref:Ig-like domain-containing protein n=1 Tax=Sinocyclocheilus anshuiensis TaxID=1608454 RepID=A0A671KMZ3_9TELE
MKTKLFSVYLHFFSLFSFILLGTEMNCISVIRVPRNTVFRAPVMTELKINCTLTLQGCHRNPRVSWCKLNGSDCKALNYSHHIRTEWKSITEHEWVAFLIFLNISMEDTGSYRCKEGDTSVSHTINVTDFLMISLPQSKPHHNTHSPSVQLTSALYRGCETPPVRGASSAGRVSDGSHNAVDTEREEENALVYASLNHQAMSRGPRRTARQEPEPSEYAAIRFR